MQKDLGATVRQWMVSGGVLAMVAVALTACGGQATNTQPAPSTTAPEATVAAVQETATTEAPAGTVGAATAVAITAATPVAATPVAAAQATPGKDKARDKQATPVGGKLSKDCAAYNAWLQDPQVQADLEKVSFWPDIIAEGEKLARGEEVDVAKMQATYDQMAKVAKELRASGGDDVGHDSIALAGKAMGLASRLAGALATKDIDAAGAETAVQNLKEAIAAYEGNVAERQAACGS